MRTKCGLGWVRSRPDDGWAPSEIAPQIWLRADRGVTVATGVSSWADQSGNGNHVVQATSSRQPALMSSLYNGLPGIWWGTPSSTATTCKLTSVSSFTVVGDYEWIAVVHMSTEDLAALNAGALGVSTIRPCMSLEGNTYSNVYSMFPVYSASDNRTYFSVGKQYTQIAATMDINRPVLLRMGRASSLAYGARDNFALSLNNGPDMSSTGKPLTIGGVTINDTSPHAGSIMEIITFNRALTATERTPLIAYLANRYQQAWT